MLFQSTIVRRYQLGYLPDSIAHYHKSLLASIALQGVGAAKQLDQHTFDYSRMGVAADGTVDAFGSVVDLKEWGQVRTGLNQKQLEDGLSRLESSNAGGSGSIGLTFLGLFGVDFSAGGSGGTDTLRRTMADLNGDGLVDLFDDSGRVNLNFLRPTLSIPLNDTNPSHHLQFLDIGGLSASLGHTNQKGWSVGGDINVGPFSGGADYTRVYTNDDQMIIDFDGDGLPDLVRAGSGGVRWRKNDGNGGFGAETAASLNGLVVRRSDPQFQQNTAATGLRRIAPLVRWTAPYTGSVTIAGGIQKVLPGGNGVIASIFKNADPIAVWQHPIAAGDLSVCVPGQNHSCGGTPISLPVQAGDRIYTTLVPIHVPGGPAEQLDLEVSNNEVLWSPNLTYTNFGPIQQPLLLEPYGAPIFVFDQKEDFRLAGEGKVAWTATSQGTVEISGTIQKGTTSDEVTFEIVRLDRNGVEYPTLPFQITNDGAAATIPVSVSQPILKGEQLAFRISSNTPIDPRQIEWPAKIRYTEFCRLKVETKQEVCGSPVTCVGGSCTFPNDPAPDVPVALEVIEQKAQIQAPTVQLLPAAPTPTLRFNTVGTATITGTVSNQSASKPVFILVQGVNRLFQKQVLAPGATASVSASVSHQPGDQVFVTVYSEDPQAVSGALFNVSGTLLVGNVRFRDESFHQLDPTNPGVPKDPMSGGFHRWFTGFYNGELAFLESKVKFPVTAAGEPLEDVPSFTFAVPGRDDSGRLDQGLWLGPTARTFVGPGRQNTSRFGFDDGIVTAGGGLSALRSATTWNLDLHASAGAGVGVSAGFAKGRSNTELDFFDFNGDRFPDAVTLNGVLFGDGQGNFIPPPGGTVGTPAIPNMNPEALRRVEHRAVRGSVTASHKIKLTQRTDSQGRPLHLLTLGLSAGHDYSMSMGSIDWLDVNGDGLPDLVQRTADHKTAFKVKLNYGYKLSEEMDWPTVQWATQNVAGISHNLIQDVDKFWGLFGSEVGVDQIRVEDSGSNNLSVGGGFETPVGGASAGGGWAYGVTRTIIDLIDINGDGLPDQVMKLVGENFARVHLNLGDRFDPAETKFQLPGWTVEANTGPEGVAYTFLGPNGTDGDVNDALQYRRTKSFQVNLSFKVCFLFVCVGGSGYHATSSGGQNSAFEDVDGDGYVDQVLKITSLLADTSTADKSLLYAKLNKSSQVNLLTAVHRPLGGSFSVTYKREGNLVRPDIMASKIDQPSSKNVLAGVDADDGRGNHHVHEVAYDPFGGNYDRLEREDHGFSKVTVTRLNGPAVDSRTETQYDNQNFYRSGLVLQTSVRDANNMLFAGEKFQYETPPASVLPLTGSFFPRPTTEETRWYEGLTANFDAASKTNKSSRTFDGQGRLTKLVVEADDGDADNVTYDIAYDPTLTAPLSRVQSVTAKDPNGAVLRTRNAIHDFRGALTSLTLVVVGGKDPVTGAPYTGAAATNPKWTYTYDQFGNVTKTVDPRGYTLDYVHDDTAKTYVTSTTDSFSYRSFSSPNFFFGVPQSVTDVNGQMELFTFDDFGRTLTVSGPNDIGTSEATIAFAYSHAGTPVGATPPTPTLPAWAKTSHKDVQHAGNPIVTVSFVDGLGRVIQTKKDLEKDTGTGTSVGMTVSGAIEFDALGRVLRQGQPKFDTAPATTFVNVPMNNATLFGYDVLDRTTSVTAPDGAKTTTTFGFDTLAGVLRLSTTAKDANVNAGGGLPGAARQTFSDVRGVTVGVKESNKLSGTTVTTLLTRYEYDRLSQLTKVTDTKGNNTTAVYDSVGRMVSLTSPDAGKTEWRYDLSGNLGAKQTAKLARNSQTIQYQYDFNRLKKIDYPTSTDVTFTYGASTERGDANKNLAGRLKKEISEAGSRDYQYDRHGNVTREHWALKSLQSPQVDPYERTMLYTYDSFARLLTAKFPDAAEEVVSYSYDLGGNVTKAVGVNSNPSKPGTTTYVSLVGYDEFEQRTRLVYGNGIEQKYAYEPLTRRLSQVNAKYRDPALIRANKPARDFAKMRYAYDKVGNITELRNDSAFDDLNQSFVLTGTVKQNFTYDDLYQLKSATGTYQENSGWRLKYGLTYNYDSIGNILKKQLGTDRELPVQGNPGQWTKFFSIHDATYTSTYAYAGPRPHAPTRVDEKIDQNTFISPRILSYDDSGNQTGWVFQTNETRVVEWNEEDRISRITLNGVELSKASYDGSGGRAVNLQVPAAGTVAFYETAYFGQNLTLRNGSFMTKHIFLGDTRIASKMDASWLGPVPTTIYFHDDQLGSTNFLTNDVQELVAHEEYFPTGELWVDEFDRRYPLRQQAYLFNGKELDAATGLYYYGARYYDPHLSMWASPDPILARYMAGSSNGGVFTPGNLGLYTYTLNNPVVLRDPTGLEPIYITPEERREHLERSMEFTRRYGETRGQKALRYFVTAGLGIVAVGGLVGTVWALFGTEAVVTGTAVGGPVAAKVATDPRAQQAMSQAPTLVSEAQAAAPVVTRVLSSGEMGKIIDWGTGQAPQAVQKTLDVTARLSTSSIEKMIEQGLTKDWVVAQLRQYGQSIAEGGAKLKNTQLLPRAELMKKLLDLWPKNPKSGQ